MKPPSNLRITGLKEPKRKNRALYWECWFGGVYIDADQSKAILISKYGVGCEFIPIK